MQHLITLGEHQGLLPSHLLAALMEETHEGVQQAILAEAIATPEAMDMGLTADLDSTQERSLRGRLAPCKKSSGMFMQITTVVTVTA